MARMLKHALRTILPLFLGEGKGCAVTSLPAFPHKGCFSVSIEFLSYDPSLPMTTGQIPTFADSHKPVVLKYSDLFA